MAVPSPWGWHQLDPGWARSLVADAHLPAGALVLDIGAGHGVITEALLAAGARVIAVELHPDRVHVLRDRFGHAARSTATIAECWCCWPERRRRAVA